MSDVLAPASAKVAHISKLHYSIATTALVLIDVLNEFLADDGKINPMIRPMLDKLQTIAHLERLVAGVRAAGLPIVYAPHGLDEHSFDDFRQLHPRQQMAMDNHAFWKGSRGAEFFASLAPKPGDIIATQHRMFNAFNRTDLEQRLHERGIEKVILAGLTSQTCVEGTGRHALEAGFHVTFLTDAVADFTDASHDAAIEISYPTFGHAVSTVTEFLAAIGSPAQEAALRAT